ncbi:MAG TPA: ATP-binding protein [Chroococcales cyanobacterium]
MRLDLAAFQEACSPQGALIGENEGERYYIDLSPVRGGKLIEEFKKAIALSSGEPTCQLLAAPVGSWKAQELQRLKAELEKEGWHVVYCKASQDVDFADVTILDVLLMFACQVSASLEALGIQLKSNYFARLFNDISTLQLSMGMLMEDELSLGIAKLIASSKNNPQFRLQLRLYLEPQTEELLNAINEELLQATTAELKLQGKRGLVAIVDGLENVTSRRLPIGRMQLESLFIDQGIQLRSLNCHKIYTIPPKLISSNEYEALKNRLGGGKPPKMLPMVPVRHRDGRKCAEGMKLMQQVVLVRAFPDADPEQRIGFIEKVFDSPETLARLCDISGGYVRHLLALLHQCFWEENPPFSRNSLERVIEEYRLGLMSAVDEHEWKLLHQVQESKHLSSRGHCRALLTSMFVYEYHDSIGPWFDPNPVLIETEQFKSAIATK